MADRAAMRTQLQRGILEHLDDFEIHERTPPGYVTVDQAVEGLARMRDSSEVRKGDRSGASKAFEEGRDWLRDRPPAGWLAEYGVRKGKTFLFDDTDRRGLRIDIENIRGHNLKT